MSAARTAASGRWHDGCRYQGVVFAMRSRPGWAWVCLKCGQGGEMPADWFPLSPDEKAGSA